MRKVVLVYLIMLLLMIVNISIYSLRVKGQTENVFQPPGAYGDWEEDSNWSLGHVPKADEDARIPEGKTAFITKSDEKQVKSVTVEKDAMVGPGLEPTDTNIKTSGDIKIDGKVAGDGDVSLDADGKTTVTGTVSGTSKIAIRGKAPAGQTAVDISGSVEGSEVPVGDPGADILIESEGDVTVSGKVKAGDAKASAALGEPAPRGGDTTIDTHGTGNVEVKEGGEVSGGKGALGLEVDGGQGGNVEINAKGKKIKGKDRIKGGEGGDTTDPDTKKKGKDGKPKLEAKEISFLPPYGGVIGGYIALVASDLVDLSFLYEGAISSSENIFIRTGTYGVINLQGIPSGVNVLLAETRIDLMSNNVILDPGVSIADITEPDAIISSPEEGGGIVIPVDKLDLLAPYIGLTSTIIAAAVVTAIYVKRVKRRKEKQ